MSTDATLRALSRDDDNQPFTCLRCGHVERWATDRCTECHLPKGDDYR